jgi:S-methylmethionine-dependent homocysteine/selenocysteine methylase
VLLETAACRDILWRYYRCYLEIAAAAPDAGFILESPTWRAGIDWGAKLGFDVDAMQRVNAEAVVLMSELRSEYVRASEDPSSSVAASDLAATATWRACRRRANALEMQKLERIIVPTATLHQIKG